MRKYRHFFYRSCESGCFVKVIAVLRFVPPGIPTIRNLRKNEKSILTFGRMLTILYMIHNDY